MARMTGISVALAVFSVCVLADPQGPPNIPEECRPQGPPHQREVCCQLPRPSQQLMDETRSLMEECANMLGIPAPGPHGPPGPPPSGGGRPPHNPRRPCIDECVFNKLGLLTADMKLNPEAVSARVIQEFGSDAAWTPVIQEAAQTCSQTAASSVPVDASCTSGAAEFKLCLMRTMYMNCPSDLKTNSDTCAAELERMARCPYLRPPPPPRPQ